MITVQEYIKKLEQLDPNLIVNVVRPHTINKDGKDCGCDYDYFEDEALTTEGDQAYIGFYV